MNSINIHAKNVCVTGAPGVALPAGKPGLTAGIMVAPGAPGFIDKQGQQGL